MPQFLRDYKQSHKALGQLCKIWSKQYKCYIYATEHWDVIWLHNLLVPTEGQNKGRGSRALKALKIYAKQVKKGIKLDMTPDMGRDRDLERFYEKHGFVRYDDRPNALIFPPHDRRAL